jgi:hypothetical protein
MLEASFQQRFEQSLFGREMVKQAALANAGSRSHGIKRHVSGTDLKHHGLGGIEDKITGTRNWAHGTSPLYHS